MKGIRTISIKVKLLLTNVVISGAVVTVATAVVIAFQLINFRSNLEQDVANLGAVIANNSTAALAFNDAAAAAEVVNSLRANPLVAGACLARLDKSVLASFWYTKGDADLSRFPAPGQAEFDEWNLRYTAPVKLEKQTVGQLYLQVNYKRRFTALMDFYVRIFVGVIGFSFALAFFLSRKLGSIITDPLLRLAETAQHVGDKQDYSVRASHAGRGDELGLLADAFNQMLSRIQTQDLALKESQERYEASIAGAKDGIWDWNLNTNEIFYSPQWKLMAGYAPTELPDSIAMWESLLHPEDLGPTKQALQDYLGLRRESFEVEYRLLNKQGHYKWMLARGAARRKIDGKAYRMAGSQTDIHGRKKAEVEVQAARAKYEALVNSIDGIVWEWNPHTSTFSFVSPQSERLLGYSPADWLGDPKFWNTIIHPDDREPAARASAEALAQRQPYSSEYRVRAADQRVVWIRESGIVLAEHDQVVALRGIYLDITEQKRAAEELAKLNDQIARTQRQAGMAEVATGVLHNVGNVLNSVNVSAALLRENLKKSQIQNLLKATNLLRDHAADSAAFLTQDPKGQRLPGFLVKLGDHLATEQRNWQSELEGLGQNIEHIKEIVAMQQSYARVSGLNEAMNAQELVEDALRMNEAGLKRHGVTVVREFQEVPPVGVDKHKVLQILINLVRNAKHAMDATVPNEKTMTVTIQSGRIGFVVIQIRDTGVGIARENLTRIFQHGFTTKKEGHGFGLHSGANAAREMGGNLLVHSDGPTTGATFTLELPVAALDFCPVPAAFLTGPVPGNHEI